MKSGSSERKCLSGMFCCTSVKGGDGEGGGDGGGGRTSRSLRG